MASTRTGSGKKGRMRSLLKTFRELKKLKPRERFDFAVSYTLMLELMNTCENAYRTFRLEQTLKPKQNLSPVPVTYVLTAHPTESRSSRNIAIFL